MNPPYADDPVGKILDEVSRPPEPQLDAVDLIHTERNTFLADAEQRRARVRREIDVARDQLKALVQYEAVLSRLFDEPEQDEDGSPENPYYAKARG